jgi:chromosomal replication initiation ATPase DnaA
MKTSNNKDKSERVIVNVRMRPYTNDELVRDKEKENSPIEQFDTVNNVIKRNKIFNIVKRDIDTKTYSFDSLLDPKIKQEEVFQKSAKSVVDYVLKGYNGTIFAYGQTGTGKTHTMVGDYRDKNQKGIVPRSFEYIFDNIKNDKDNKYTISLSFIQIYLETVKYLLK